MKKELNCSIDLPLEEQYRENWDWENSFQRYELDQDFQEQEYFDDMDPDKIIRLNRKMDNFMMERGISIYFIRNYERCCEAFRKLDNK